MHGEGQSAWSLIDLAVSLGAATRVGLEDTFHLPDGSRAADSAALVRAAILRLQR